MVSTNAICCPQCQGQNVQLLSVIHAAGTSHIQATHQAQSQSGFGPSVTVETTGRHQAHLAASVAPPGAKRLLGPVILTGVGAIILYDGLKLSWEVDWTRFFIGVTFIAIGVIGFVRHCRYNIKQYDEYEEWRRTWLCHACGTRFQP